MHMYAYARSEVLRETDPVKEHCGSPSADAAPQKGAVSEQSQPRGAPARDVGPHCAFQTFVDGDGI
jgi:hypothetical protein